MPIKSHVSVPPTPPPPLVLPLNPLGPGSISYFDVVVESLGSEPGIGVVEAHLRAERIEVERLTVERLTVERSGKGVRDNGLGLRSWGGGKR